MIWLLLSTLITVVHAAPCTNIHGTVDNNVDCTCGTSECTSETGHYCTLSVSVCSGAASNGNKYFFQNTGTRCPSGNRITDMSGCNDAQVANGGSSSEYVLWGYYGTGSGYDCTVYNDVRYKYNYNGGSGSSCSADYPCVCQVVNPVTCSNSDGTVDNGQNCLCGDSLCTSETGFFCYQPTSTCIKYDPCANTDGTVDNGQNCQCGSTPCEGPKHYCSLKNSYCGGEQSSPKNEFFLVTGTSGTTTVNGYRRCATGSLPSYEECRYEAMPIYGKTSFNYYTYVQFPYGCWLNSDHRIMYNQALVSAHCSSTYPCVCRRDRFIETCYNGDGTTATSIECECGDEDCSPGEYCNIALSTKCSSTKSCQNIDGTQILTENCRCNTENCNSGEYCVFDDTSRKCRAFPLCQNGQNSVNCKCGNALCDANEYCTLSTSVCAPTDQDYVKAFLIRTSGNCASSNLEEIDSLDECAEAAAAVGWGSSVDAGTWNNYGGCYSKGSSGGVAFNDAWDANCGTSYPCVCKSIVLPCQITDGLTANTGDCGCGSALCTASTGRYCTSSENKCRSAPPCTNFDGTVDNGQSCICIDPSLICTSDSGFYCYADKKQCARDSGVVWWPNPRYQKLSGHCNEYILDADDCLARATIVAQEMGFANPISTQMGSCTSITPWGCSLQGFIHQTPRANLCLGSSAALNGVTETSACNQYVSNSYKFPCLCESDSFTPLCSNTDGTVPLTSTSECYCLTDPAGINQNEGRCTRSANPYCNVNGSPKCKAHTTCAQTLGQTSNAVACYCGSVTCSGSSLYCVSELNTCYQAKVCLNRDGTVQNDGPCLCGSATCSESSGFYCYADNSLCGNAAGLAIATAEGITDFECLIKDGTSKNTDQCVCGDEYCDAGKFCEPNDGPPDLKLITSGRCNDDPNYVGIYDDQACKDAMPTFGIIVHEYNFASHTNYWYPRGCYIRVESGIEWPGNNHAVSSNADYATNTLKLLCRLTNRAIGDRGCFGCLYTDGLTANPDSCWCGDVSCSSSRRYCSTELRQCVSGTPDHGGMFTKYMLMQSGVSSSCSNYPGWSHITTVQGCDEVLNYFSIDSDVNQIALDTYPNGCFLYQGNTVYLNSQGSDVECSPDSQCYCKAQAQQCEHQDGITVNSGDNCWCGDEFCTSGLTGLVCSNGQCSRPNPCAGSDGYSLTTEICSCGNVDCLVGKYCYSGGSVCLDTIRCESIDGSQRNSDSCSCGDTLCTEYPGLGLRCNEAMNLCFLKVCDPLFTGQETEPCLCGSAKTYCAPGSYCWSAKSQVSTSGIFSQYDMITSGSCTDDPDGSFIRSGSECNGKIGSANDPRTYAGVLPETAWLTAPPACSLVHTWSAAYYFNPYDPLHRECEDCMCRYTQYPPCNSNIEVASGAPCECGTEFCHEGTVFCDLQNNKCLPWKPCANKDHTALNTESCFCRYNSIQKNHWRDGAYTFLDPRICHPNTYCDADEYGCSPFSVCAHTNGLTINNGGECACGNTACAVGAYCNILMDKCFDYLPCQYNTADNTNPQACACGATQCTMYDNGVGTGLVCDQGTCYRPPTCQNINAESTNDAICACGDIDCGSGLFCYASTSECKPYGYCGNTDGTVENSDCTCGSVDCDSQSPYCHSDRDTCLSYPKCSQRDGTIQNQGMCACGTTDCTNDNGLFCNFDINECRPGPPCTHSNGLLSNDFSCACGTKDCAINGYEYEIRTSGSTCETNGWGYVENVAQCTDAGQALGISASVEPLGAVEHFHIGCIHYHSDNVHSNTNRLLFVESSVGNFYCGWGSAKCICRRPIGNYCESDNNRCRPGAPCIRTEGLIPNDGVCACGVNDCPDNKLYCNLDNHDCRPGPPCAVKDGTAATNEICACGPTSDCSIGEFCYESQDRCKTYTHCEHSEGFTENQVTCTCGSDDCSAGNGLYCNLDVEICGDIQRCQNNKGLLANAQECQCGYVQCNSQYGFYCYEDQSLCSDSTDFLLPHIRDHWSGCTGDLRRITTDAECAQVVPALWLRYDTEHKRNWYKDVVYNYVGAQSVRPQFEPYGCGLQSYADSNPRDVVMWIGSSGAACNSYERPCICALDTRACQDRSGTVPETQECMCGTTFCTGIGKMCNATANTCDYEPCSDPNGLVAHVSDYDGCTCNGESCSSETGLFCNADHDTNKCRKYPRCSNTIGTIENLVECTCGADDCTTNSGLFCSTNIQGGICFKQPLCPNRNGINVNNIACQCGLNQCAAKQTCLESSSQCLFPECSEIDGFVPNQDTCNCGGEVCSEENTYQYIGDGKCEWLLYIDGEYFLEPLNNNDDKLLECMNRCIQHGNGLLARPVAFTIDSNNQCGCASKCVSLSGSTTEYTSYHIIYGQDGGLHCSKTRKQCSSSNIFTAYKTRGNGCPQNPTPYNCPDYCVPGGGCHDSEGFSPLSSAECQIASAQSVVANLFGLTTIRYVGNYISTDSSGSTDSWRPRGCTVSSFSSVAMDYMELDHVCKSTSLCTCYGDILCIYSREMPICTERDGLVINDSPCICGKASCTSVSGLYCSIDTESCSKLPKCSHVQGLVQNDVPCVCGTSECPSNKLFCDISQNDCRSYAKCPHPDGDITHPEHCACGDIDCLPDQLCTKDQPLCEYPICSSTDGLIANPPCVCGSINCVSKPYCLYDSGICSNIPACASTDATDKTDIACACASNTRHENCVETQYCDKNAQKQCFYEDCSETSGNVANTFDCACGDIDCFQGNPFCNVAEGRCQTKLTCPLVDGQIPNSVECDCGGDICDSSNPFCKIDVGECRAQRRCLEVDGTQPNTLICQCGEDGEECSGSTPYCNAQYKKCAPVANVIYELFYTSFWLQPNYGQSDTPMAKTTKTTAAAVTIPYHTSCEAAGLEQTTTVSECQAGSQLLWDVIGFYHKNDRDPSNYRPMHIDAAVCVIDSSKRNVYHGGVAPFAQCGQAGVDPNTLNVMGGGDVCICRALWHSCYFSNNEATTDRDCTCGDARCEPGQFCDFGSSTCKWPDCQHTDGVVENWGIPYSTCQCGDTLCIHTANENEPWHTGLFCQDDISSCSEYSKCPHQDGTQINPGDCTCGSVDCLSSTGLYCFYSLEECFPYGICQNGDRTAANTLDCQCIRDGFIATSGTTSICTSQNPYCSTLTGECFEPPCESNTGKIREGTACTCSYELKTNSTGLYTPPGSICSGSRGQDETSIPAVLQHPFCENINGKTPVSEYCYCLDESTPCGAGQYCSDTMGTPFCSDSPVCDDQVDFEDKCACYLDTLDCDYQRQTPGALPEECETIIHKIYGNDEISQQIQLKAGVRYRVTFSVVRTMISGEANRMDSLYLDGKNFGGCKPPFTDTSDCSWAACAEYTIFPVQKREYFTPESDTVTVTASFSGDVYTCYCNHVYATSHDCSKYAGSWGSQTRRGIKITFLPMGSFNPDDCTDRVCDRGLKTCRLPYCPSQNRETVNPKNCICGNTECTQSTGRLCDAQNSQCGFDLCENLVATKNIDQSCECSPSAEIYGPTCFAGSLNSKCFYPSDRELCQAEHPNFITNCGCTSITNFECPYTQGKTRNIENCACGTTVCGAGQYCNALYSKCSLQNKIPSCHYSAGLKVNTQQCLCGGSLCGDGGFYCDPSRPSGTECFKKLCSTYDDADALCDAPGFGNGIITGAQCTETTCTEQDRVNCCKPCNAGFQVFDGQCRQQCLYSINGQPMCNIQNGLIQPPPSTPTGIDMTHDEYIASLNKFWTGYCDSNQCQLTDNSTCCVPAPKCDSQDPQTLCTASIYTGALLANNFCQNAACSPQSCCEQRSCICQGGTPAQGALCPDPSVHRCVTCNSGRWLNGVMCQNATICGPNQWQFKDLDIDSDRICYDIRECDPLIQYESVPPTSISNRQCKILTSCLNTEFQTQPPTNISDRQCQTLTTCQQNQYESVPPTNISDRQCQEFGNPCQQNQYESQPPTNISDRQCQNISNCQQNQFQTQPPTTNSDRQCQNISNCQQNQFQTQPPTNISDRQCQTLTTCQQNQYESVPPTNISDRQCQTLTTCQIDEFQTQPPTNISDRQCQTLTTCQIDEYELIPPTNISDRQCTTCSDDETDCKGCIIRSDCTFNPNSKVIEQAECSGLTCETVVVSEAIDPILKVGHWYRFQSEQDYTLDAPGLISKPNYEYFNVQTVDDAIILNGNQLKIQQDCLFEDYVWQGCQLKCGNQTELGFRGAKIQEAKHGGIPCEEVPEIVHRPCIGTACPVDCVVQWDAYFGKCSAECGLQGLQYKNYTIIQDSAYGGQKCPSIVRRGCVSLPEAGKCDCIGNTLDICGVCGGDGKTCLGCDGQPNSGKIWNRCGKCALPSEPCVLTSRLELKETRKKARSNAITIVTPIVVFTIVTMVLILSYKYCAPKQKPEIKKSKRAMIKKARLKL